MLKRISELLFGDYQDGRQSAFLESAELLENCYIRESELSPRQVLDILAEEIHYRAETEKGWAGDA